MSIIQELVKFEEKNQELLRNDTLMNIEAEPLTFIKLMASPDLTIQSNNEFIDKILKIGEELKNNFENQKMEE